MHIQGVCVVCSPSVLVQGVRMVCAPSAFAWNERMVWFFVVEHTTLLRAENRRLVHSVDIVRFVFVVVITTVCCCSSFMGLQFVKPNSVIDTLAETWAARNCLQPSVYYVSRTVLC